MSSGCLTGERLHCKMGEENVCNFQVLIYKNSWQKLFTEEKMNQNLVNCLNNSQQFGRHSSTAPETSGLGLISFSFLLEWLADDPLNISLTGKPSSFCKKKILKIIPGQEYLLQLRINWRVTNGIHLSKRKEEVNCTEKEPKSKKDQELQKKQEWVR